MQHPHKINLDTMGCFVQASGPVEKKVKISVAMAHVHVYGDAYGGFMNFEIVETPGLISAGKGVWTGVAAAYKSLPAGKSICLPSLSVKQKAALRAALLSLDLPGVVPSIVGDGEKTYVTKRPK